MRRLSDYPAVEYVLDHLPVIGEIMHERRAQRRREDAYWAQINADIDYLNLCPNIIRYLEDSGPPFC